MTSYLWSDCRCCQLHPLCQGSQSSLPSRREGSRQTRCKSGKTRNLGSLRFTNRVTFRCVGISQIFLENFLILWSAFHLRKDLIWIQFPVGMCTTSHFSGLSIVGGTAAVSICRNSNLSQTAPAESSNFTWSIGQQPMDLRARDSLILKRNWVLHRCLDCQNWNLCQNLVQECSDLPGIGRLFAPNSCVASEKNKNKQAPTPGILQLGWMTNLFVRTINHVAAFTTDSLCDTAVSSMTFPFDGIHSVDGHLWSIYKTQGPTFLSCLPHWHGMILSSQQSKYSI